MFKILQKTFATGIVTAPYPAPVSPWARGCPDGSAPPEDCPTGAIEVVEGGRSVDYGRCTFCGLCPDAGPRPDPIVPDGRSIADDVRRVLGRSLAIRQVDAGSCNGCELEIGALNNPVYDLERFGIHFVASPRHADMLLVTGPVTRNMELALRKAYAAMPEPRLVVAVGACAISGGIFGVNYATLGGVDAVLPVDVYIPGCPPPPQALLSGILLALGRQLSALSTQRSADRSPLTRRTTDFFSTSDPAGVSGPLNRGAPRQGC